MMMRFFSIIVVSLCVSYTSNAQLKATANTTTQQVARTGDTTKSTVAKHVKTRMVGGAQMTSDKDIVYNIVKSKDHTTLTGTIAVCGLSETLKSRGPLTVFAPTNEAFAKLAPGTLDTLSKPAHNTDLTRLLTYHVINGRLTSKDIAKQIAAGKGEVVFVTLTGSKLRAKINGDRNIVLIDEKGNEATISQFDIEQSNGIIDVVTSVLVPNSK
ncbi:putative surface protein with fasciclin (FAS1) repeats [Mucilaginibacter gracilis]|uniref:Putative surface protein with fasciclin (FAS1) repeats n=1 Tax=Mucilaginibacter gracilis TaxID=423350 RepID=A0A495J5B5_9SPHI|nr:fasciclin domain-containing protein [Mucilaginibacter gracilis]RKR83911.1 putative surface protein with fasciclin (FAS1) repeats [Mucilaginibacter gracilis]